MTPENLILVPFTEGDTWEGLPMIAGESAFTLQLDGAAPPDALVRVSLHFASNDQPKTTPPVEISSDLPAQIVIDDSTLWKFSIPEQPMPGLTAGKWRYNLRTQSATGAIRTWIVGTIEILESV